MNDRGRRKEGSLLFCDRTMKGTSDSCRLMCRAGILISTSGLDVLDNNRLQAGHPVPKDGGWPLPTRS